jgi:hypothetical protein
LVETEVEAEPGEQGQDQGLEQEQELMRQPELEEPSALVFQDQDEHQAVGEEARCSFSWQGWLSFRSLSVMVEEIRHCQTLLVQSAQAWL